MKVKYFLACFLLFILHQYINAKEHIDTSYLKEEFNLCPHWHDGMTWEELYKLRKKLQEKGLIQYFDKIKLLELAQEQELEVPEIYLASREKTPFIDIISELSTYVVKPSHLSLGDGLIIVKNGIDMVTGKPITPEQVQESVFEFLDTKPVDWESWALHQVEPGFIVQEYVPNRLEAKIQVVWGKAIIGSIRGGERKKREAKLLGKFDRDGNRLGPKRQKYHQAPKWWSKAIETAEELAKEIGADALRVDFLVKENGQILLNELETSPGTNWSRRKTAIETRFNDGYRNLCKQLTQKEMRQ